ncbi:siderophore ABC transporter substrate-binding protein [uncultured Sphingobacterium sp.]|jgi:iron complex transport system substrate-binding protein
MPDKIVVLDIGALETLHELKVKPAGIPKKFMPNYLDDLKNDTQVADVGSVIEPDFEAISLLNPDLILISTRQERFYKELSDIAPTIYIGTDNKDYLNSFEHNTLLLGSITGKENEAKAKLEQIQSQIQKARDKYAKDQHKALFLLFNNGRFSAFGKGSRFGFIYDVLQFKPVMDLKDESVHGQKLSNELIAQANPDYLFIVDRNAAVLGKVANKADVENPLVKQTKAYQNQAIYYLDPNVWFISGGGLTSVKLMTDDILRMVK